MKNAVAFKFRGLKYKNKGTLLQSMRQNVKRGSKFSLIFIISLFFGVPSAVYNLSFFSFYLSMHYKNTFDATGYFRH